MTGSNKSPFAIALTTSLTLLLGLSASVSAFQDSSKPQDIKPAPYMPKGAIKLPTNPTTKKQASEKAKVVDTDSSAAKNSPLTAPQDQSMLFSSDALAEPDPAGVAALEINPEFSASLWGKNSREDIIALLSQFKTSHGSAAVNKRAKEVLRAPITIERPNSDIGVSALMRARLAAMRRLNDTNGYTALLHNLAADVNWQGLTLYQTNAALAAGRTADACMTASNHDAVSDVDFWLKLKVFCSAVEGDRTAVDFNLAVLEETIEISATYYQLIDAVLIEAEQSPNIAPGDFDIGPIIHDLPISLIEVTMARVMGAKIETLSFINPDPLAVPALLSQVGLSETATGILVETAITNGWGDANRLRQYLPKPEVEEVVSESTEIEATIDDTLNNDAAPVETLDDPLLSDIGLDESAAELNDGTLTDTALEEPVIIEATSAILDSIREALNNSDNNYALATFRSSRAMPAGQDPSADLALIETWPLMQVFENPATTGTLSLTALTKWWETKVNDEARFDKALSLFSTLEGLGFTVPDDAWIWLEDGPVTTGHRAVSAAHWRRFLIAARSDAKAELYASLMPIFASSDPLDPTLAGSVLSTLIESGDSALAKDIGLEMLVQAGL